MINTPAAIIAAFVLAVPLQAQVHRGSLVVWIVSKRADYVVIGAESRSVDVDGRYIDDRSCKVISVGGDTLFFETGTALINVHRGKSWNSAGVARAVYAKSQRRDARSLARAWGNRAVRWFYESPEQEWLRSAEEPNGALVTGGFLNFDKSAQASVHSTEISYNAAKRSFAVQPSAYAPGRIGAAGVATNLVIEYFDAKTDRAVRAIGSAGRVRSIGVDPEIDVGLVRNAIRFAMENAFSREKMSLGGDIDIAILRRDRNLKWIERKPWCSRQDLQPTQKMPR